MTLENDPAGFIAFKVVRSFFFSTVRLGARVPRAEGDLPLQNYGTRGRGGYDQQYYKQGGKRTLTLRTFFKFVWGSGWGVKKQPATGYDGDKLRFPTC